MTTLINADTVVGGAVITGDGSGELGLQAAGVTKLTVSSSGVTLVGLTYPTADGTNNQVIITDGSGTLSFATISATPFSNSTALAQVQAVSLYF